MYNSKIRQYVFRQSTNKVWNIFCDERRGLCYSNMSRNNAWLEPVVIQKDVHLSFYTDMDEEDTIHILFQDNQGNLHYSNISGDSQTKLPVLSSKLPSVYNKHMLLFPQKVNSHAMYVLNHKDSLILSHQLISLGNVGTPKVIDYVNNIDCPYTSSQDQAGTIYAFYQASDGKHLQLVYKKFNKVQKSWGDLTPLTRHNGDCSFASVVTDGNDVMHICYQRQSDRRFDLVYQQKVSDKNIWTPEILIHNSVYPFKNSAVACINEEIIIFWIRDDSVYFCKSKNNGSTWSKPAKYPFPSGNQLVCLSYKSNINSEKGKITTPFLPGSLTNGFKLAFYQDAVKSSSLHPNNELKPLSDEDMAFFKRNIEELKEFDTLVNEKTLKMSQLQQTLEKEIIKYSVKMGLLENDLNMLKHSTSERIDFSKKAEDYDDLLENYKDKLEYNKKIIDEVHLKIENICQDVSEIKSKIESNLIKNYKLEINKITTELAEIREFLHRKQETIT